MPPQDSSSPPGPETAPAAATRDDAGSVEPREPLDFSSVHSGSLPLLLKALGASVLMTSYQSSRMLVVRSDGERIDTDLKIFPRPMGLAVRPDRLVLGIWAQVLDYRRNDVALDVGAGDPLRDACFMPRASHVSGMINIHDIAWGRGGLWAVNSMFSCLCTFGPDASFVPRWQPHFISELVPEDRCHLNGLAMRDDLPAYVTTFCRSDRANAWRDGGEFDGTLMDVAENRILVGDLCMPHSPRWHRGEVYFCESGRGLVRAWNPDTGSCRTVVELPGFTRGLAFAGPLMFVGLSQARVSRIMRPPPIAERETESGLRVVDLDSGEVVAGLRFEGDVAQIYDVAVLPGSLYPEIVEWDDERVGNVYLF
jgi:uncharacterized protein (TIGR03032 family)